VNSSGEISLGTLDLWDGVSPSPAPATAGYINSVIKSRTILVQQYEGLSPSTKPLWGILCAIIIVLDVIIPHSIERTDLIFKGSVSKSRKKAIRHHISYSTTISWPSTSRILDPEQTANPKRDALFLGFAWNLIEARINGKNARIIWINTIIWKKENKDRNKLDSPHILIWSMKYNH